MYKLSIKLRGQWYYSLVVGSLGYCLNTIKTGFLYGYRIDKIKIDYFLPEDDPGNYIKVLPLSIDIKPLLS